MSTRFTNGEQWRKNRNYKEERKLITNYVMATFVFMDDWDDLNKG